MKSFISTGLAGRLTQFTLIGRSPVAVWPCCFFLHLGGNAKVQAPETAAGVRDVVRASTPISMESVDPALSRSLPWEGETWTAYRGEHDPVRRRLCGLRGRGQEACPGTRSSTDADAHCEQGAGSANSPASAADKPIPPPAGLAAASGSRREGIPDPEGSGKICVRGAELQSRPLGSGAQGF